MQVFVRNRGGHYIELTRIICCKFQYGFKFGKVWSADIFITMERTFPLLNPQQIDQLNSMISSISRENNKTLEDVLGEQAQIANLTMMQLYSLVVEEWGKKQKIIDNLCHFALTMMSTVEYLWAQKNQDQDRITTGEAVVQALNRQLQQLAEENQACKSRINEAESQIDLISEEKQTIEELYRTQSCRNFSPVQQNTATVQSEEISYKQYPSLQEQRSLQLLEDASRALVERQKQIEALKIARDQLKSKVSSLLEQNQLAKMEVQLAELAIKDALTQKLSASMISNRSADLSYTSRDDDIYTTKSHANFLNGELDCFSTLHDNNHKNNSLLNQIIANQSKKAHAQITPSFLNESHDSLMTTIKDSPEDTTAVESPFKKKHSIISHNSEFCALKQSILSQPTPKPEKQMSYFKKNKKTVSLQCNLIKGLPKLSFNYKECAYEVQFSKKPKVAQITPQVEKIGQKGQANKEKIKNTASKQRKMLSKSEILKNPIREQASKEPQQQTLRQAEELSNLTNRTQGTVQNQAEKKSFTSLYGFLTAKLVSQRIKVK